MAQLIAFIHAVAFAFGISGCVAAATIGAADHKRSVAPSCALSARPVAGAVEVAGRFTAATAATGQYDLTILESGAGGLTTIRQSGRFAAGAGETVQLGTARIGGASDLGATMVVTLDQGAVLACEGPAL
jgi:hypothetical protein